MGSSSPNTGENEKIFKTTIYSKCAYFYVQLKSPSTKIYTNHYCPKKWVGLTTSRIQTHPDRVDDLKSHPQVIGL